MRPRDNQTSMSFALDCPICRKASENYRGQLRYISPVMDDHPRCEACGVLVGEGHVATVLVGGMCPTHVGNQRLKALLRAAQAVTSE